MLTVKNIRVHTAGHALICSKYAGTRLTISVAHQLLCRWLSKAESPWRTKRWMSDSLTLRVASAYTLRGLQIHNTNSCTFLLKTIIESEIPPLCSGQPSWFGTGRAIICSALWFPSLPQDRRQSSSKVTTINVVSDLDLLRYDAASSGKSFPTFRRNVWPLSSKGMLSKKNATYHVHSKRRQPVAKRRRWHPWKPEYSVKPLRNPQIHNFDKFQCPKIRLTLPGMD